MVLAQAAVMAGESVAALNYLERAYQEHHDFLVWNIATDVEWDPLRGQPRFKRLLSQLRLN
jgi:hypothetical protein